MVIKLQLAVYALAGLVVAAEARGFIFAAPLAIELKAGFVPVRKPGKLPFDTHAFHYELEYGQDTLQVHADALGAAADDLERPGIGNAHRHAVGEGI